VDIGALASFRFDTDKMQNVEGSDTTTTTIYQVPEIKLKDIISPGVFFSIGIPKTPLSINLGIQMGPNLRKVSISSTGDEEVVNDYNDRIYWRYSASLVVDIPLLNFYTTQKK
jgi:hypothetical protein